METESQIQFNRQYITATLCELASRQEITTTAKPIRSISPLLNSAKSILGKTYRILAKSAREKRELTLAGEWLIDNFYIIQEQIVGLKQDMPSSYYKKLPILAKGIYKGFPRIYELVQVLNGCSDNVIDRDITTLAVQAYQEEKTLTIGELWAIPIMIRLALLTRLELRAKVLVEKRALKDYVETEIALIFQENVNEPGYLLRKIPEIPIMGYNEKAFLTELALHLQLLGTLTDTERRWFKYKFNKWNITFEEALKEEAHQTSRLHLSIQNSIVSLRTVSETDWTVFVENCSVVEQILQLDPAGIYPTMDFETRNKYRVVIERLQKHSPDCSEQNIAEKALLMAEQSVQSNSGVGSKKTHIGYYLISHGYIELARRLNYKMPFLEQFQRWMERHSSGYFLFIAVHVIVLLGLFGLVSNLLHSPGWFIIVTLGIAFMPTFELSVVSTNRILNFLIPPRILPKLAMDAKIPDGFRTMVVVPTLLSSPEDARNQIENLEIRALANHQKELQFTLLSDFLDAANENMPGDKAIIETAKKEIKRLNEKYSSSYGDKFYLLHRKRKWNPSEEKWIGWERKRGKLEEFDKLLMKSGTLANYKVIEGDIAYTLKKTRIKYIITLDSDTKLPPGSAVDLIRTAAHPLNHAELNESKDVVVDGYGIFQPHISISPKTANQSWFAKVFSGIVGIDPYTTAVSDIYQDTFGEGIFTGKGLYDVEVFETVLGNRFPENTILSHDLLESTYLRTALVTDIELFDDYPVSYLSYSKRNHRWIRGDWQILHWLFSMVPGKNGKERNPINKISKWKIFDNLRRSLNPFFILIFLLAAWIILPGSPLISTLAALGITAFPIYSSFSVQLFQRPARVMWNLYFDKIRADLQMNTIQALTTIMLLPHQAYTSLDAILRTLWRMKVSNRLQLEWTTASQAECEVKTNIREYYKKMWINLVWSALCLVLAAFFHPEVLILIIPFAVAWSIAPYVSYLLGQKVKAKKEDLTKDDIKELRKYARRTWNYFERFVNEEHNWLVPDNFQEHPYIGAAERTSPTNMGMALTATYTAYSFGYITQQELLHRLGNMLGSMKLLNTRWGHFYNWYDTKSTEILQPKYISTVDSGNLAAALLVIKQGLQQLPEQYSPNIAFWEGLQDTVNVLREITEELKHSKSEIVGLVQEIVKDLDEFESLIPKDVSPENLKVMDWSNELSRLSLPSVNLKEIDFSPLQKELTKVEYLELLDWFSRPFMQIESQQSEIQVFLNKKAPISHKLEEGTLTPPDTEWQVHTNKLAGWCDEMVQEMDFSVLFNKERKLFSIGYSEDQAALDIGTYDLLASEARLASYIAIAKGEAPPEHWFRLSRSLTSINSNEILLSWGGTMFEYLMPVLFMEQHRDTLLKNTYKNAVSWQQNYGESHNKPWGFSESGYGILNLQLHYQYRAFGVPGLGLRRGLAEDFVVAPYATMLALMIHLKASIKNLQYLKKEGAYGMIGFYEAIDYTQRGTEPNTGKTIIKMYMAHHQGMGMLAIANVLKHNIIQQLFHADPLVQSCDLLLQERIPRGIPIIEPRPIDVELEPAEQKEGQLIAEHITQDLLFQSPPRLHILSNGRYSTVITHAGTGYSFCDKIAITRWRPDAVSDPSGFFFYIKDLDSNEYWSMGYQPVGKAADRYDSWFHPGLVQTARVDEWTESFMEICVSPEDNIELRKLTLTNYAGHPRRFELTSYAEVVLNQHEADVAHQAFSSLSIQTDYIPEHQAIIARRRPREKEPPVWMVHTIASSGSERLSEQFEYETDRNLFIGRGRNLKTPAAMDSHHKLSGSLGNVLDPILSLRRTVELAPGEKISITFGLGKADSREEAEMMAESYDNSYAIDRAFELADIYGKMELEHINISAKRAHYFYKLAGTLIYGNESLRAKEEILLKNRKTQSGLWAYGISGDLPILLYKIKEIEDARTVERLLRAHTLFRLKGLETDLVIINEHQHSYLDELHEILNNAIQASQEHQMLNKKGGVFLIKSKDMPPEDMILLESVAKAVFHGVLPPFNFKTKSSSINKELQETLNYRPIKLEDIALVNSQSDANLQFYNEYGGFTKDGREYVIPIKMGRKRKQMKFPPAPWINVIANPNFGFLVTESGSSNTWSKNSHENRITPWSNDAVSDPTGEALYIRDEESGLFWSATPNPIPGSGRYEVRHGFGYTSFESEVLNIQQQVTMWVLKEEPVKVVRLRLSNTALYSRNLSIFRYVEWVLGIFRYQTAPQIITELDKELQTIFACNFYNNDFARRVAFATQFSEIDFNQEHYDADRENFIGRNNNLTNPAALREKTLGEGRFGIGFDSCASSQMRFVLGQSEQIDIYFLLGETATEEQAKALIKKYRSVAMLESSLEEIKRFWKRKLGTIQIQTPVPELNVLANGWLLYQNLSCRIWGRTAFYQSAGAFGFRDQLQDVAAAMFIDNKLARDQILLHAAHQFPEGDVLHWWHPPADRGTRTRITDDLLWLPYLTDLYIKRTGDKNILQEKVSFIEARQLEADEQEAYLAPEKSNKSASLYEHCCLAIDRSLTSGAHGLPFIGAGDWNDGLNRVGEEGKGESVWLGFFLYTILDRFISLCKEQGDEKRISLYDSYQKELKTHLNKEGWDGDWYRRAFYDDGSPLGSAKNEECKIDSLPQSWAAISGAGQPEKIKKALEAADRYLVDEENSIIRLFTPPFDQGLKDPGYIKGYIPGVRENGGQYTHAALWLVKAFAEQGHGNRAVKLMQMLSPINHSKSRRSTELYRVEPYVVAADIYGEYPLTGMGGWTWYTGAAGWMYSVIIESILGIEIRNGTTLHLNPSISSEWKEYTLSLREQEGETTYHITIKNTDGLESGYLSGNIDDEDLEGTDKGLSIALKSDGETHRIILNLQKVRKK